MAETLAEFRRSNLSEVLRAKETLEATIATLPDAVLVIDPEGRIVTLNPLARSVLQATGAAGATSIEDSPFRRTAYRSPRGASWRVQHPSARRV